MAQGQQHDEVTQLPGRALLLVRCMVPLVYGSHADRGEQFLHMLFTSDLDALVQALLSYYGCPQLTLLEQRLLTFLLSSLHDEATRATGAAMLHAGPPLPPASAYLTSMPMLCRIARSVAQLVGVPMPEVPGAGAEAGVRGSSRPGGNASGDGGRASTAMAAAVRAVSGAPTEGWPGAEGVMGVPYQIQLMTIIAAVHWAAVNDPKLRRAFEITLRDDWLADIVRQPYDTCGGDATHPANGAKAFDKGGKAGREGACANVSLEAAPQLRSDALGRLAPRLVLARGLLPNATGCEARQRVHSSHVTAVGSAAAAFATGAAAAANALRDWLGTQFSSVVNGLGRKGVIHALNRDSSPVPPWAAGGPSGGSGARRNGYHGCLPPEWLRTSNMVVGLSLTANDQAGEVRVTTRPQVPGLGRAAFRALEAAGKQELLVYKASTEGRIAPEQNGRVAALATVLEAALAKDGAAVVAVGGGGDGSCEGAPEAERQRRRQAAEAELAEVVAALAKVGATHPGAIVVPLPYAGPTCSVAVWHACVEMLDELSENVQPPRALHDKVVLRWAESLEWDDPDPTCRPQADASGLLLGDEASFRRALLRNASLPDRPSMRVEAEAAWEARLLPALNRVQCRMLGLEPLMPGFMYDTLLPAAEALEEGGHRHAKGSSSNEDTADRGRKNALVRRQLRRRAARVLDVGELAASGLALVVVGAERLREAEQAEAAEATGLCGLRRLLVAAGAGIPGRLLSSRPSQQAQALAQQPLRGAWRASATYRPALRAAATAALTVAASAARVVPTPPTTAPAACASPAAAPGDDDDGNDDDLWQAFFILAQQERDELRKTEVKAIRRKRAKGQQRLGTLKRGGNSATGGTSAEMDSSDDELLERTMADVQRGPRLAMLELRLLTFLLASLHDEAVRATDDAMLHAGPQLGPGFAYLTSMPMLCRIARSAAQLVGVPMPEVPGAGSEAVAGAVVGTCARGASQPNGSAQSDVDVAAAAMAEAVRVLGGPTADGYPGAEGVMQVQYMQQLMRSIAAVQWAAATDTKLASAVTASAPGASPTAVAAALASRRTLGGRAYVSAARNAGAVVSVCPLDRGASGPETWSDPVAPTAAAARTVDSLWAVACTVQLRRAVETTLRDDWLADVVLQPYGTDGGDAPSSEADANTYSKGDKAGREGAYADLTRQAAQQLQSATLGRLAPRLELARSLLPHPEGCTARQPVNASHATAVGSAAAAFATGTAAAANALRDWLGTHYSAVVNGANRKGLIRALSRDSSPVPPWAAGGPSGGSGAQRNGYHCSSPPEWLRTSNMVVGLSLTANDQAGEVRVATHPQVPGLGRAVFQALVAAGKRELLPHKVCMAGETAPEQNGRVASLAAAVEAAFAKDGAAVVAVGGGGDGSCEGVPEEERQRRRQAAEAELAEAVAALAKVGATHPGAIVVPLPYAGPTCSVAVWHACLEMLDELSENVQPPRALQQQVLLPWAEELEWDDPDPTCRPQADASGLLLGDEASFRRALIRRAGLSHLPALEVEADVAWEARLLPALNRVQCRMLGLEPLLPDYTYDILLRASDALEDSGQRTGPADRARRNALVRRQLRRRAARVLDVGELAASGLALVRRLLVAAGAGIPTRLLSSRPSQQAQALAQQPLRGAWRAGATYRPALRASATAALTAATSATHPSGAEPPLAPASLPREGDPGKGLWGSLFSWAAKHEKEGKRLAQRIDDQSRGRRGSRAGAGPTKTSGKLFLAGNAVDEEDLSAAVSNLERVTEGYELMDKCKLDDMMLKLRGAAATDNMWRKPQIHRSVLYGACASDGESGSQGCPHDAGSLLAGRALLAVRAACALIYRSTPPRDFAGRQARLSADLDALVQALVLFYGEQLMTSTELRLLTFLLAELHGEVMRSGNLDPLAMLGSGPRLPPASAYLTSMPMLCRIARSAAQLVGVPAPAVPAAGAEAGAGPSKSNGDGGTGDTDCVARVQVAAAVAALCGASAAGWPAAEAVMEKSDQRQLMTSIAKLHWAGAQAAGASALPASSFPAGASLPDLEAVATALSSARKRGGREYGIVVRSACRGMSVRPVDADAAAFPRVPSHPAAAASTAFLVARELWNRASTDQLLRAMEAVLGSWLPDVVLQPYGRTDNGGEGQEEVEEHVDGEEDDETCLLSAQTLGRLGPRMHLARGLLSSAGVVPAQVDFRADGAAAAALAFAAAAATNAVRAWLSSVLTPAAADADDADQGRFVRPLQRTSAPPPPWVASPSVAATNGARPREDGDDHVFPWTWSEEARSGLDTCITPVRGTDGILDLELVAGAHQITGTAWRALETAETVRVSCCAPLGTEEDGSRVTSLAAAVEAAFAKDGSAVVAVGGSGDGSSEGATAEERQRRRQAAEAELAEAVEALAEFGAAHENAVVVPVPYRGPCSSVAVWHACVDLLDELADDVTPAAAFMVLSRHDPRQVFSADASPEVRRLRPLLNPALAWSEALEWDDPDPQDPDVEDKVVLDLDAARLRQFLLRGAGLPQQPSLVARWGPASFLRMETALDRVQCRLLGLDPVPPPKASNVFLAAESATGPDEKLRPLPVEARMVRAAYDGLVRRLMRRQARRVLDVGELAASGLALVVVDASKLGQEGAVNSSGAGAGAGAGAGEGRGEGGPPLTPAQRRLLVAAGAGIPARLLTSRPSQQAQALAQQPLRGAWRAGATYRPALRAAATAALTAAASATHPSGAKPPLAPASLPREGDPGKGLWGSLFSWVAEHEEEGKRLAQRIDDHVVPRQSLQDRARLVSVLDALLQELVTFHGGPRMTATELRLLTFLLAELHSEAVRSSDHGALAMLGSGPPLPPASAYLTSMPMLCRIARSAALLIGVPAPAVPAAGAEAGAGPSKGNSDGGTGDTDCVARVQVAAAVAALCGASAAGWPAAEAVMEKSDQRQLMTTIAKLHWAGTQAAGASALPASSFPAGASLPDLEAVATALSSARKRGGRKYGNAVRSACRGMSVRPVDADAAAFPRVPSHPAAAAATAFLAARELWKRASSAQLKRTMDTVLGGWLPGVVLQPYGRGEVCAGSEGPGASNDDEVESDEEEDEEEEDDGSLFLSSSALGRLGPRVRLARGLLSQVLHPINLRADGPAAAVLAVSAAAASNAVRVWLYSDVLPLAADGGGTAVVQPLDRTSAPPPPWAAAPGVATRDGGPAWSIPGKGPEGMETCFSLSQAAGGTVGLKVAAGLVHVWGSVAVALETLETLQASSCAPLGQAEGGDRVAALAAAVEAALAKDGAAVVAVGGRGDGSCEGAPEEERQRRRQAAEAELAEAVEALAKVGATNKLDTLIVPVPYRGPCSSVAVWHACVDVLDELAEFVAPDEAHALLSKLGPGQALGEGTDRVRQGLLLDPRLAWAEALEWDDLDPCCVPEGLELDDEVVMQQDRARFRELVLDAAGLPRRPAMRVQVTPFWGLRLDNALGRVQSRLLGLDPVPPEMQSDVVCAAESATGPDEDLSQLPEEARMVRAAYDGLVRRLMRRQARRVLDVGELAASGLALVVLGEEWLTPVEAADSDGVAAGETAGKGAGEVGCNEAH
ncbi:hypothetical protein HYH03_009700 [Edaphochlamys debaryana]|uniref:Uncharacterized protein n=1 Tax=Edaphochlamys debaryana TaxID=47281 RepID=A0A835XY74_9CHLO|nr:hypothetical protein HYH03_009700 [Edaphochlamys debaryana]|eukprot:KAG2491969.1 hypothetical protein HYH03_009700 [Edaphochlamys debaryana]